MTPDKGELAEGIYENPSVKHQTSKLNNIFHFIKDYLFWTEIETGKQAE